jgi:hypothetical protein
MVREDSGRRSFFRLLTRDLLVEAEELRGVRHVTYGEILAASDEKLGWLVPVIRKGIVIVPGEEEVKARMPDGTERRLFESTRLALVTFNSFNGQNTLEQVGRIVSAALNWPQENGFRASRALFLKLVCEGVAESCRYWS